MLNRRFVRRRISDFDFFFCFLTNTIFVRKHYVWVKHELNRKFFFCLKGISCRFFESTFIIKSFAGLNNFWPNFWSFVTIDRHNTVGFFLDLELIGLGYRIRKITAGLFRFFWGYANFVYLFVPKDVLVEYLPDDRLIFFFGINPSSVNSLVTYLMLLKKISSYRVTGFIRAGKIVRLNSGKQR